MEKSDVTKLISLHIKKIDQELNFVIARDIRAELYKAKSIALQSLVELIK